MIIAWFDRDPKRFLLEKQAMQRSFPGFQLCMLDNMPVWLGTITSNRNRTYQLLVEYPVEFPYKPPTIKPLEPEVLAVDPSGKLKHQYPDGRLCLFFPGDRTFSSNTTAASVVAVAAAWFFSYESWLESGRLEWPGNEVNHELA